MIVTSAHGRAPEPATQRARARILGRARRLATGAKDCSQYRSLLISARAPTRDGIRDIASPRFDTSGLETARRSLFADPALGAAVASRDSAFDFRDGGFGNGRRVGGTADTRSINFRLGNDNILCESVF